MATITQNRDYIEYHVNHLQEKYWLDQLRFDRKHNLLYIQYKQWYRKNLIFWIKEIIAYIDGLYEWIKIMKKMSDLSSN